ncbi:MAG TPA: MOSC domain-containing protein [Pseudomonadales bacterium]|nr:MOSC domain-containing protein [Pseudomonadales bacterium]
MTFKVDQLWRYPVKSLVGETLEQLEFGADGAAGDRAWAVRDEVKGGIRGARRLPGLMRCAARYPQTPAPGPSQPAVITLPDGSTVGTLDADVHARLSAAIGHEVTLWPLMPASDLDHYRRGPPVHEDPETEFRTLFARTADEPLPDLSVFPEELMEFESRPGTYFDAAAVLVIASSSLARLQRAAPESRFDVRRFRPNLVIDTGDAEGWVERDWIGRRLRIGELELSVDISCPRCAMTTHPFDDLPKDPKIMRTLVRENQGDLGVYCTVTKPGIVRLGDSFEVL